MEAARAVAARATSKGSKMSRSEDGTPLHPRAPIRRFDIFAEYNRLKALADGLTQDEAMGYGLWLAKVVASRSFGRSVAAKSPSQAAQEGGREGEERAGKWHTLDGKPQTDELFDKEIVRRMGRSFYSDVFAPAIEEAVASGKSYNAIRDTLRRNWTL